MKLKICGIKSTSEAASVLEFDQIDLIGVILAPSKRRVDENTAKNISALAHKKGKLCVGVFVDEDIKQIISKCQNLNLDIAQLHIKNSAQKNYAELKSRLNAINKTLFIAASVDKALPKIDIENDLVLYDASGANAGGNGISFDWGLLSCLKKGSFGIAGGIGASNIAQAAKLNPALIDLNSKLEDENGIKSSEKIAQTLQNLKDAT